MSSSATLFIQHERIPDTWFQDKKMSEINELQQEIRASKQQRIEELEKQNN